MTWNITQADCLEWLGQLPADSVDLVFGSPPYEQARLYLENGRNLGVARDTEAWIAWMVQVYKAALRVCKGLVAFVVEGQTRNYRYSCGPALLMADLCRAGIHLRKPPIFHRVGIPGSGGPDWWRGDTEYIICATRGGRLPWSDPTACGHVPKWAPGGEMSHRMTDGARVNQWGMTGDGVGNRDVDGTRDRKKRPSHRLGTGTKGYKDGDAQTKSGGYDPPALANPGNVIQCSWSDMDIIGLIERYCDEVACSPAEAMRALRQAVLSEAVFEWGLGVSQVILGKAVLRQAVHGRVKSETAEESAGQSQGKVSRTDDLRSEGVRQMQSDEIADSSPQGRKPAKQRSQERRDTLPAMPQQPAQNDPRSEVLCLWQAEPLPGSLSHTLQQVEAAWRSAYQVLEHARRHSGQSSDLMRCLVGGGLMGSPLAHLNEAPFPESLCEKFVRSFCPPGGTCCDPFSGSGTTAAVSMRWGRNFIGCDLRASQVELAKRRLATVTPEMFV